MFCINCRADDSAPQQRQKLADGRRRAGAGHAGTCQRGADGIEDRSDSEKTRQSAKRDYKQGHHEPPKSPPSRKRSRATHEALEHEGTAAASHEALSKQAKSAANRRTAKERSTAAKKAATTKGPAKRSAAAKKAAKTKGRAARSR